MFIKKRHCLISMFLTILFCGYSSFIHSLEKESSFDCFSSTAYGSCQKPSVPEPELDVNTGFNTDHALHPGPVSQTPQLLIFVSNSMPEESLRQWAVQANKAGGTLLLRGFIDDSLKTTLGRVVELFGEEGRQGFSIDPERFEELGVDKVPAVAISLPQASQFEADPQKPVFELVYGDVPLDEALSVIARRGSEDIQKAAQVFLQRYREP